MMRLFLILGIATLAAGQPAGEPIPVVGEPARPEAAATPATGLAGLRVVRDPISGRLVEQPTPAQLGRLAAGAERSRRRPARELRRFSLPAGGEGVFLDGWADQSLAVERAADGSWHLRCAHGADPGAQPLTVVEEGER